MKEFDVKQFVAEVTITREELPEKTIQDDCEYEVTKKAMDFYIKYPCYTNWTPFLYGGSLSQYLCYERINKDGYRGDANYRGAYLLKNDKEQKCLTADIITSIKSPINIFLRKNNALSFDKSIRGEEIQKILCAKGVDGISDSFGQCAKAFAIVYYWCGNMMPVICNPLRTGIYGDNWMSKMNIIISSIKEDVEATEEKLNKGIKENIDYKELWPQWIREYWLNKGETAENIAVLLKIIEDNYLRDFFDINKNDEIVVKEMSASKIDERWFLNNAKLVVQRTYRIYKNVQGRFTCDHIHDIQEIFKYVFNESEIPEKEWDLNII